METMDSNTRHANSFKVKVNSEIKLAYVHSFNQKSILNVYDNHYMKCELYAADCMHESDWSSVISTCFTYQFESFNYYPTGVMSQRN